MELFPGQIFSYLTEPDFVSWLFFLILLPFCRLEALNDKRSSVVQMVKLAEKERDSLEVQNIYIKHMQFLILLFVLVKL